MKNRFDRSRGQAMTEFTIIVLLVAVALISSAIEPSPVGALLDALREACKAFSFVISYSV
jgi:ABC-type branched-subunit amino acid transport system permease subunit